VTITTSAPSLREDMSDHPSDEPRYVTSEDAARILGMSVVTIRRAAKAGRLPGVRISGEWRFLLDDLRNLPKGSAPKPESPPGS